MARSLFGFVTLALTTVVAEAGNRLDGFNIVASTRHPFGSSAATRAIGQAKRLGATALAIVPFFWQASPQSASIIRGNDMTDEELRSALVETKKLGMAVIIKPHVWVPGSWAGAVEPASESGWHSWFTAYGEALVQIARVAAEENADAVVIGTELGKTSHRTEWSELVKRVRAIFPGRLLYVAQNFEEAERIEFWPLLDAIGISLYPPLGADDDREGRLKVMNGVAAEIDELARRLGKPVIVGEVGLRSAQGAAAKPWESAEERVAPADRLLQAQVLGEWLHVLNRPSVQGILVWRWLTDPAAGGASDTDFTVQGKPAEGVLLCAWSLGCEKR